MAAIVSIATQPEEGAVHEYQTELPKLHSLVSKLAPVLFPVMVMGSVGPRAMALAKLSFVGAVAKRSPAEQIERRIPTAKQMQALRRQLLAPGTSPKAATRGKRERPNPICGLFWSVVQTILSVSFMPRMGRMPVTHRRFSRLHILMMRLLAPCQFIVH